jgi:NAD(P)-dependent dehydrogenase (short-subunit alcohol dehydrogenase family)
VSEEVAMDGIGFAPGLMAGRVAVITAGGGAICGEAARLMAHAGADLVLSDVDADRLASVAGRIRDETGREALTVCVDLRTADGMRELARAAFERFERVDVLVNGLGEHLATAGAHEDSTEEQWQALYEVNLLHVFRATKAFVPSMKRSGWGRIVNFSSVEGVRSAPALAVYSAFKRAVDGFTKSLAVDLARHGILVSAVAVDKTRAYQVDHYALPEEYARLAPTWIPAGRYGEPADVANVVVFLASPLNSWVVGSTVVADGGTLSAGGWFRTPKRWTNQPLLTQYLEDPHVNDARPPAVQ